MNLVNTLPSSIILCMVLNSWTAQTHTQWCKQLKFQRLQLELRLCPPLLNKHYTIQTSGLTLDQSRPEGRPPTPLYEGGQERIMFFSHWKWQLTNCAEGTSEGSIKILGIHLFTEHTLKFRKISTKLQRVDAFKDCMFLDNDNLTGWSIYYFFFKQIPKNWETGGLKMGYSF